MIVLPDAVNRIIVSSFLWTKHRNVMERRMNRIPLASTAVGIARNVKCKCKNVKLTLSRPLIISNVKNNTVSIYMITYEQTK